jgi:cobaltochelatase CobN
MPTGRNLYAVDPRATPTRAAAAQGARLAEALIRRHLQDHGDWPRSVVVDLWGSAAMRTAGEEFAMALALMGVSPRWEDGSERVVGFVVEPLAALGRPRIDVTLRVSGLFRDVFEDLPRLFEQAAAALAERDEAPEDNPYRAVAPRVFGPAPGAYGVGLPPEATRAEAGEAWLAGSAFAYGRADGAPARAALEERVRGAQAFVHPQDLPETDLLTADDYAAHEGGFAAAAAALGAAPALYHLDATRPEAPVARPLAEEVARVVRARAANPAWVAGMTRHGFRGAAEIAQTLDAMAAFATLADAAGSHLFDLYFDATLGEPAVRDFMAAANPAALAAMRARFEALREAGFWTPRRNSAVAALAAE